MKKIIERTIALLVCMALLVGDNAFQVMAVESLESQNADNTDTEITNIEIESEIHDLDNVIEDNDEGNGGETGDNRPVTETVETEERNQDDDIYSRDKMDVYNAVDEQAGKYFLNRNCFLKYTVSNGEVTITGHYGCEWFEGNVFEIPSSIDGYPVTTIGDYAFIGLWLGKEDYNVDIIIPESVITIGEWAFSQCDITGRLVIPNGVKTIGENAFSYTKFTGNLIIPDSVKTIGYGAFSGCTGFTGDLTIPYGVTTIENLAFAGCTGLSGTVTVPETVELQTWPGLYGHIMGPFEGCNFTKVVSDAWAFIDPPYGDTHKWYREDTGEEIYPAIGLFKGVALRDDYVEPEADNISPAMKSLQLSKVTYSYQTKQVDVLHSAHAIEKVHKPFNLICESSGLASVKKYELYDGTKKMAESDDGTFIDIDPSVFSLGTNLSIAVVGANATYSQKLKLKIKNSMSSVPNRFEFGKKVSFRLPEDFPFYGGDTMSFDIPVKLPINAVYEDNTIKIGINIIDSELYSSTDGKVNKKNKKTFKQKCEKWKEDLLKAKKVGSKTLEKSNNGVYKYLKNPNVKGSIPGTEKKVDFTIFGYAEGTISDVGFEHVINGELVVAIEGSSDFQKVHPVVLGFVTIPVTVSCEFSGKGELTGKFSYDWAEAKFVWDDAEIGGTVSVAVEPYAGVGIGKLASVGVYGQIEVGTEFTLLPVERAKFENVYIYGEAGIKGYLAYMENKWSIFSTQDLKKKWPAYFDDKNRFLIFSQKNNSLLNKPAKAALKSQAISDEENIMDFDMIDTVGSYLAYGLDDSNIYIQNAYPAATPQIAEIGGKTILIFTDYVMSRAEANRTAIKYAVYNAGTGTFDSPQVMFDDGTADTYPVVYSDGQNIFCAYMNSNKVYEAGEEPDISDYAATFGISVSKYNKTTGKFDDLGYINANNKLCYMAALNMTNEGLSVAWAENSNNTFMGMDDANEIYYSLYNGQDFTNPKLVCKDSNVITGLAVSKDNDIAWTKDIDNDYITPEQVLCVNGKEMVSGTIGSLCYCCVPGMAGEALAYNDNGGISYINGSVAEELVPEGTMDSGSNFYIYKNGIYYLRTENEKRNICVIFKDGDRWSPTTLTDENEYIDSFAVGNGKAVTLSTKVNFDNGSDNMDTTSNIRVIGDSRHKLLLVDASYEPENATPLSKLPVMLSILNNGTESINNVSVDFYSSTAEHQTQTVEVNLKPGENRDIVVYFDLPEQFDEDYTIEIGDPDKPDFDNEGCTEIIELTRTELSVSTEYVAEENAEKVAVNVSNESAVDSKANVEVRDYNGNVMLSEECQIPAYSTVEKMVSVHDIIPANDKEGAITATIVTSQREYYENNNSDSVSIWRINYVKDEFETTGESEEIENGISENAKWQIDENGIALVESNVDSESNMTDLIEIIWDEEAASKVKNLLIDESISSISKVAISNCNNLENITILNRNCGISDDGIPSEVEIRGYYGSTAYDYAKAHNMTFTAIDEATHEHKWDNGTITKDPTLTEDGKYEYTCEYCSTKTEVVIPMTLPEKDDAKESMTYSINFDSQGGTIVKSKNGIEKGSCISLPEKPYLEKNSFLGWYTEPNGEGIRFTEETPVTENMTLYAFWGLYKLDSYQAVLNDNFDLKFIMNLSDEVLNDSSSFMEFNIDGKKQNVKPSMMSDGCAAYYCKIPAKQINDVITARLFFDGKYYEVSEYSLKEYFDNFIVNDVQNPKYEILNDLSKSILNYGSYCQKYFGYKENNLANKDIYTDNNNPVNVISDDAIINSIANEEHITKNNSEFIFVGASLTCLSNTYLNAYFSSANALTLKDVQDNYEVYVNGVSSSKVSYSIENGILKVTVKDIPAAELDDTYEFVIKSSSGSITVEYCPLIYIKKALNSTSDRSLKDLCKALYLYNQESNRYF